MPQKDKDTQEDRKSSDQSPTTEDDRKSSDQSPTTEDDRKSSVQSPTTNWKFTIIDDGQYYDDDDDDDISSIHEEISPRLTIRVSNSRSSNGGSIAEDIRTNSRTNSADFGTVRSSAASDGSIDDEQRTTASGQLSGRALSSSRSSVNSSIPDEAMLDDEFTNQQLTERSVQSSVESPPPTSRGSNRKTSGSDENTSGSDENTSGIIDQIVNISDSGAVRSISNAFVESIDSERKTVSDQLSSYSGTSRRSSVNSIDKKKPFNAWGEDEDSILLNVEDKLQAKKADDLNVEDIEEERGIVDEQKSLSPTNSNRTATTLPISSRSSISKSSSVSKRSNRKSSLSGGLIDEIVARPDSADSGTVRSSAGSVEKKPLSPTNIDSTATTVSIKKCLQESSLATSKSSTETARSEEDLRNRLMDVPAFVKKLEDKKISANSIIPQTAEELFNSLYTKEDRAPKRKLKNKLFKVLKSRDFQNLIEEKLEIIKEKLNNKLDQLIATRIEQGKYTQEKAKLIKEKLTKSIIKFINDIKSVHDRYKEDRNLNLTDELNKVLTLRDTKGLSYNVVEDSTEDKNNHLFTIKSTLGTIELRDVIENKSLETFSDPLEVHVPEDLSAQENTPKGIEINVNTPYINISKNKPFPEEMLTQAMDIAGNSRRKTMVIEFPTIIMNDAQAKWNFLENQIKPIAKAGLYNVRIKDETLNNTEEEKLKGKSLKNTINELKTKLDLEDQKSSNLGMKF